MGARRSIRPGFAVRPPTWSSRRAVRSPRSPRASGFDSTLAKWVHAAREAKARSNDPGALKKSGRDELRGLRKENVEMRTTGRSSARQPPISPVRDDAVIAHRFVSEHREVFPVSWCCDRVAVPRSSFYALGPGPTVAATARGLPRPYWRESDPTRALAHCSVATTITGCTPPSEGHQSVA